VKTTINGQYDNSLVIESLNILYNPLVLKKIIDSRWKNILLLVNFIMYAIFQDGKTIKDKEDFFHISI